MAVSNDYERYVLEQLVELGDVQTRRMFGGVGLYHDTLFFALIDDDVLYFKVDESSRVDYVARGMKPFCPYPNKPGYEMGGYYQVPADVLEEPSDLVAWARRSCDVALAARESKPVRKTKSERKKEQRPPKVAVKKGSGRGKGKATRKRTRRK